MSLLMHKTIYTHNKYICIYIYAQVYTYEYKHTGFVMASAHAVNW